MLTRAGCQVPFLLTIVLDTSCQAQVKAASCYADRLTPDPNLSRASACPGQGWQAVSQATVSHSTVFPPGDFPFLLGLPRSVRQEVFYFLQHPAPTRSSIFSFTLLQFLLMPTQKPLFAPPLQQSQIWSSVYSHAGNLGKYNPFKSVVSFPLPVTRDRQVAPCWWRPEEFWGEGGGWGG